MTLSPLRWSNSGAGYTRARFIAWPTASLFGGSIANRQKSCATGAMARGRCNSLGFLTVELSLVPSSMPSLPPWVPTCIEGRAAWRCSSLNCTRLLEILYLRRVAIGGLRHALSRLDALPLAARPGLFTGWIGKAMAAARMAKVLGDESLSRAASD